MADGGVVAVILLLIIAAGVFAGCWWHRRRIRLEQSRFLEWAGEQLQARGRGGSSSVDSYSEVDDLAAGERSRTNSDTSISFDFFEGVQGPDALAEYAPLQLDHFEDKERGFRVSYPRHWQVRPCNDGKQTLVVQFCVPSSENTYMRLSVACDDIAWSPVSARVFSRHVVNQLPAAVPHSRILSDRALLDGSGYELLYTVPRSAHGDGELTILNYHKLGNKLAFTIAFAIEESNYEQYETLARHLLDSFQIFPLSAQARQVKETPASPDRIEWQTVRAPRQHLGGVTIIHPRGWTRQIVQNPRVMRFHCSRNEQHFKMVNYFIVDLSALSVDNPNELLSELVDFYKQEVGSMGSTVVREIYVKPEQQKAGLVGPFWAFQTTSRRGFIDVRSQVLIALHGSSRTSGHIITVSTSARAFDQYQSFSRHIFQQFHATNRPVAGSEGKAGRGVQGGAGGLTRADFESSSV